jgi:Cytochrome P460
MKNKGMLIGVTIAVSLAVISGIAISAGIDAPKDQDRYTVAIPGGLAFSEFRGYEKWQVIAVSQNQTVISAIVGNPEIIEAFQSGIPGNGKPFPDGSKMAKIHWNAKRAETEIGQPLVPDTLKDVEFMVKDSKRFADSESRGWGFGDFRYELASKTFRPGNSQDIPPSGNNAKCGSACHVQAQNTDFVFTKYPLR